MSHDELEFTRAPRENLKTYDFMKRMIVWGTVFVLIVLGLMAAFLV
jgi:hypothetical protein